MNPFRTSKNSSRFRNFGKMMKKTISNLLLQWLTVVVLPMILGAAFYQYFRSKRPIFLGEEPVLGLYQGWFWESTPSFLWSFALASAMLLIWKPRRNSEIYVVTGFVVVVSFLFEFWQAANAGRGTFDLEDCVVSVVGCLFALLLFKKMIVHEKPE